MTVSEKICLLIFLTGMVGGCAESSTERAQRLEPMLAQAGFRMVPADTAARSEKLGRLTPLRMNYQSHNGKSSYWFADPYVCHCLYVGSEQNYGQFEQLKHAEQEEKAQNVTDMADQARYEEFINSPAGEVFYGQ